MHTSTLATAAWIVLVGQSLFAQERPPINPDLGLLMGGVKVQVRADGTDSTQWFRGRVVQTRTGCTHIQLQDALWQQGELRPEPNVPAERRVSVALRAIRRLQTAPLGTAVEDTNLWSDFSVERLLRGEPPGC